MRARVRHFRARVKTSHLASIKLGLRPDEAAEMLGSEQIFREMVAAGWVRPVIQRHRLTLFDRAQLSAAWARLIAGESLGEFKRSKKASENI